MRPVMQAKLLKVITTCLITLLITACGESQEEVAARAEENARSERDAAAAEAALVPPASVQAKVKKFVTSQGLWCGKVTRFREDSFKSSVNNKVYYVFCDDDTNAQGYEIRMEKGAFVSIEEV
jgi:hypothetical protein